MHNSTTIVDPDNTRLTPTRLGSDAGYAPSAHLVHYWMHDHTDVNTSRAIHKKNGGIVVSAFAACCHFER